MTGVRKGSGPPGRQGAAVRVRTARSRSISSTLWLQRQLNDQYVSEAKRLGYRSRAAFKLAQLDDRFGFLKPGVRVLDLGAAPGGWCQIAVERTGGGAVFGIDYLPLDPIPGALLLQLDFLAEDAVEKLTTLIGGPVDVVLTDMAAPTTGHTSTDHLRVVALVEAAYEFASGVLTRGGTFLAKVFQGGTERALLDRLKRDFATVRHVKPPASRKDSAEVYVVALGFAKRDVPASGGELEAAPRVASDR